MMQPRICTTNPSLSWVFETIAQAPKADFNAEVNKYKVTVTSKWEHICLKTKNTFPFTYTYTHTQTAYGYIRQTVSSTWNGLTKCFGFWRTWPKLNPCWRGPWFASRRAWGCSSDTSKSVVSTQLVNNTGLT